MKRTVLLLALLAVFVALAGHAVLAQNEPLPTVTVPPPTPEIRIEQTQVPPPPAPNITISPPNVNLPTPQVTVSPQIEVPPPTDYTTTYWIIGVCVVLLILALAMLLAGERPAETVFHVHHTTPARPENPQLVESERTETEKRTTLRE